MHKLVQIRKFLGLTQGQFAEILRVKQNTISLIENDKISLIDRNKQILVERLHVNPEWLEKGIGEMFLTTPSTPAPLPLTEKQYERLTNATGGSMPGPGPISIPNPVMKSDSASTKNTSNPAGVPFYAKPVSGSMLESFADMDRMEPEYYIDIEPLNNCSFYRPVYGESMIPRYNPGDIVACEKIHNKRTILYGETYLCMIKIDADYYETIKVLRKNPNPAMVTLKPLNPNFDETTIPIDSITQLFIIRGKIERNI